MRVLRENLLLQFSLLALVIIVIVATLSLWSLNRSLTNSILDEAAHEAADTLSARVLRQLTPEDFQTPMSGNRYAEFDRFVQESVVSARVARIKLWNQDGMVLYSDDQDQIGQVFPIKDELKKSLQGKIAQELGEPRATENIGEIGLGRLIEVYVPVRFPGSPEVIGAFEIYQYYAPFAAFIERARNSLLLTIGLAMPLFYIALVLVVAKGWTTIRRFRREIEARLRDLEGFNRLLQSHLAGRQKILDGLHRLKQQVDLLPTTKDEEREQAHSHLVEELTKLAGEASAHTSWISGYAVMPDEVVEYFSPKEERSTKHKPH